MAPLFSQDMVFEVAGLKSLKNQLSVPTPETKAHGNLEGWSYIILENLPGESIRRVWTGHLEYELLAPAVFFIAIVARYLISQTK